MPGPRQRSSLRAPEGLENQRGSLQDMAAMGIGALDDQRTSWQVAHEALSRLARARAATDAEEGRWLLAGERAAVHVHLGYGSFSEYIERLFGYQPRSLQERLRVAEALEGLPALARALSSGELSWSAARELTRVAVRDTEQEWLDFARGMTLRQLEQVLAHRQSGDMPSRRRISPRGATRCASTWPPRRSPRSARP
jgi:hypothetical protein